MATTCTARPLNPSCVTDRNVVILYRVLQLMELGYLETCCLAHCHSSLGCESMSLELPTGDKLNHVNTSYRLSFALSLCHTTANCSIPIPYGLDKRGSINRRTLYSLIRPTKCPTKARITMRASDLKATSHHIPDHHLKGRHLLPNNSTLTAKTERARK